MFGESKITIKQWANAVHGWNQFSIEYIHCSGLPIISTSTVNNNTSRWPQYDNHHHHHNCRQSIRFERRHYPEPISCGCYQTGKSIYYVIIKPKIINAINNKLFPFRLDAENFNLSLRLLLDWDWQVLSYKFIRFFTFCHRPKWSIALRKMKRIG